MPTVFTHAVVGAALVGVAPATVSKARLAVALAVASMFPDADVLTFAAGIPYEHPFGHRGISHSLPFAGTLALLLGSTEFRGRYLSRSQRLWLTFLFFIAVASHGLLDTVTDGGLGVGLLLPFREGRFFAPWRPLQVSPIGVQSFLSGDVLGVLSSEFLVVWVPLALVVGVGVAVRGLRARRPTSACS